MDQIYIPKQRNILDIGEYVTIKPLVLENNIDRDYEKFYFYGIRKLEPIKITIIKEIIRYINKNTYYENIIITGSFLDKGFNFKDVDILLISREKVNKHLLENSLENKLGIKIHLLILDNKSVRKGLETDPLYQSMISRCVAVKRIAPINKHKINYKILDLHLLKSKILVDNFDILDGKEKYDLIRNLIAIHLFLKGIKVTIAKIHKEINLLLKHSVEEIKKNKIDKKSFLKKYKKLYNEASDKILKGIKYDSKQK